MDFGKINHSFGFNRKKNKTKQNSKGISYLTYWYKSEWARPGEVVEESVNWQIYYYWNQRLVSVIRRITPIVVNYNRNILIGLDWSEHLAKTRPKDGGANCFIDRLLHLLHLIALNSVNHHLPLWCRSLLVNVSLNLLHPIFWWIS